MVTVANDEIPEIPMNKHRTNNTEQTLQIIIIKSFSQTSLNSNIIRLPEYKLKNTVLKLIKS